MRVPHPQGVRADFWPVCDDALPMWLVGMRIIIVLSNLLVFSVFSVLTVLVAFAVFAFIWFLPAGLSRIVCPYT